MFKKIKERFILMFGLDLRSLALMRVSLGFLILFDIIDRARYITVHYTDSGIMPRDALLDFHQNPWVLSVHLLGGTWQIEAILFAAAAVFALMLIFGYKTKLSTIISWFLLTSLYNRNPFIVQGGDILMRFGLFWAIFLPWGKYYSVDSAIKSGSQQENEKSDTPFYFSGASIAYILQIAFVYWFAFLSKSGIEWRYEGTAIYYALNIDYLVTYFGQFLLGFPQVLKFLTFSVLLLQALGPFLFFLPIFTQQLRLLGAILFVLFHIGLAMSMHLGVFPFIGIITAVALLPPLFWNIIERLFNKKKSANIVIYYDSECGFCRKIVNYIRVFLIIPSQNVLPAAKEQSIFSDMIKNNSWVVVDSYGNRSYKFDGIRAIVSASPLMGMFSFLLNLSFINKMGNRLYEYIARHNRRQCLPVVKKYNSRHFFKFKFVKNITINAVVLSLIIFIFFWNVTVLSSIDYNILIDIPVWMRNLTTVLRLDQGWGVFAPFPPKDDGWHIIVGHLRNGQIVDLFLNGRPVSFAKPANVARIYDGERWRRYLFNILYPNNASYRLYYGNYLCRMWNRKHFYQEELLSLDMIYMLEYTMPDYHKSIVQPITIWQQNCLN